MFIKSDTLIPQKIHCFLHCFTTASKWIACHHADRTWLAVFLENGVISAYNQQLSSAWDFETTSFLYQADRILRSVGRISFPIFCFLLVEGFVHTSNRKKYALRLFLFACVSELPFDLCFNGGLLEFSYQNVMFTLLIGFLTLWLMDIVRQKNPVLLLFTAGGGILLGKLFAADYNWKGIVLILILYLFYSYPLENHLGSCLSFMGACGLLCFSSHQLRVSAKRQKHEIFLLPFLSGTSSALIFLALCSIRDLTSRTAGSYLFSTTSPCFL